MEQSSVIHTEYNPRTGRSRHQLRAGRMIRLDVIAGHPYQLKRLHRCRNWKIRECYQNGDCKTYYINILGV